MVRMGNVLLVAVLVLVLGLGAYFFVGQSYDEKTLYGTLLGETSEPANLLRIEDKFVVEKVADGIVPTGLAFSPDGRLFFSELPGQIKVVDGDSLSEFAYVEDSQVPIVEDGEAGVFAIAIDPEFNSNHYVYVFYTSGGSGKIGRFTDVNGVGEEFTIIFDGVPQNKIHNGGDLEFGLDGKLYLSTGDATLIKTDLGEKNPAQDINNKGGKVLRINKDGSIPKDNPFDDSYTYAYGFRNLFGLAINPISGEIYVGDQGIDCCEEVNAIKEGKNYGWPFEMGIVENSLYENPIYSWDKDGRVSPTGMAFYTGEKYPGFKNDLFLTTWRTREIYHFTIDGNEIQQAETFSVEDLVSLSPITGRHAGNVHEGQKTESGSASSSEGLLDIVQGTDGYLYFSDVKGIYRLLPK